MANAFSVAWRALFANVPSTHTSSEIGFVQRNLPRATFPKILDLACGYGRHAGALSKLGYDVLGVDRSLDSVVEARQRCPEARFRALDMRELSVIDERFDGVLCMWQSFGYFDDSTNRGVLRQVRDVLRPGGRLLLDVYNREHARELPAVNSEERGGIRIDTRRAWTGSRLKVELTYDGLPGDCFEWHVYTEPELLEACRDGGLFPVLSCAWFDESTRPGPHHARMQLLLERSA